MASSLRDELLKAGMATKQDAQKADSERRKKRKQKGAARVADNTKESARRLHAEKVANDRELNRKKLQEAQRKAVAAQIRQLIELNRLPREGGETPYNFVDDTSVRKLYVTQEMSAQLGRGLLSIVRFGDIYEIVPTPVAEKIGERDHSVVLVCNTSSDTPLNEDDLYADYQVPDDLMW